MRTLNSAGLAALRGTPGRSALLFLTDRCPVECAHCSVDALRGGPSIRDWPLFAGLVDGLAGLPGLEVVGLSGGEPFAERRGLRYAAERLTGAGKLIVPYTSGYWAAAGDVPCWIGEVIGRSSCVVLSTDAYHAARLADQAFIAAARVIARAGVPVICQVISEPAQVAAAAGLLADALGAGWREYAELVPIPLLPAGRAATFAREPSPAALGRCPLARSPVVRYDGRLTACCNEAVVMGAGPSHLQRRATGAELPGVFGELAGDAYLTTISALGVGTLAALPGYEEAARAGRLCRACWRLLDLGAATDPRASLLAALGRPRQMTAAGPRQ